MKLSPSAWATSALCSALPVLLVAVAGVGTAAAQERPIVVIDPGHGGAEAGVVVGEIEEKDLVLRIAFATAAEFIKEGFDVRLTRTGDYAVSWDDRRGTAEEAGATLLIMLHAIQSDDPNRHGAEIYFSEDVPASVRAARIFAEVLEEEGTDVVLEPRGSGFLASPSVPTVMIEAGFLTHPVERRLLLSEAYHRELARTFVRATRRVLESP
jgi:N-acetylmuramoyl-L-alanine amidase